MQLTKNAALLSKRQPIGGCCECADNRFSRVPQCPELCKLYTPATPVDSTVLAAMPTLIRNRAHLSLVKVTTATQQRRFPALSSITLLDKGICLSYPTSESQDADNERIPWPDRRSHRHPRPLYCRRWGDKLQLWQLVNTRIHPKTQTLLYRPVRTRSRFRRSARDPSVDTQQVRWNGSSRRACRSWRRRVC